VTVRAANPEAANELLSGVIDVTGARKAAGKQKDLDSIRKAVAMHVRDTASKEVEPDIAAYIKSRRREIAVEVGGATD
jgi:hypothetical protein